MKLKSWRLILYENIENAYLNLAIEEAIARACGKRIVKNTLRFWRNKGAIVIGYFQNAFEEINFEECEKYNLQIVRRFTGGGAVYHDLGNLNYSISISNEEEWIPRDVYNFFGLFIDIILNGLEKINIKAIRKGINNIFYKEKKISGLAASNQWGTSFLHGCLLISANINIMNKVLKKIKDETINIEDILGYKISLEKIIKVLKESFEEKLNIKIIEEDLTKYEYYLANKLYKEKYNRKEWNLK
jgi:lipoate-protein ligase A